MMRPWPPAIVLHATQRRMGWMCAGALLVSVAVAQPSLQSAPPPAVPQANQADDTEPITPIPAPPPADPRKLALGERLFGDVRLSADGKLSCSSCHDLRTNGADGSSGKASQRGSSSRFDIPTVFNAALNFRLNWEGNFRTFAEQAESSLEDRTDMHTNVPEVVRKLNADPDIAGQFEAAYGHTPDREAFLDALATFERSLLTPGGRFDRWLAGDASALSAGELEGYRLFKSLGCSSCHQGANVGGNLFERQGVFHPLVRAGPTIVRVPSLRNVAATAPYFHDGSAATLEEAVRRMAAAQLDRTLTDQQIASLVLFLKTLSGNYRGSPVEAAQ